MIETKKEKQRPTTEDQINARYSLMQSANAAARDGYSMMAWKQHPRIQEIRSKNDLHPDILDHIAAFVWTFNRR